MIAPMNETLDLDGMSQLQMHQLVQQLMGTVQQQSRLVVQQSTELKHKQALLDKPINTAFGPMAFDPRNNQSILDIYVNRVEKDAQGRPFNTVVHTYQRIQDPGPRS